MRQTIMEIDLKNLDYNIMEIQKIAKDKGIMPVIKDNGYGTYINKNLDFLNRFDIVGVAIVDEAIELRNIGYQKDILVLNQPFYEEIEDIEKYNISIGICDKSFIEKVIQNANNIKVHLEIETGMNRTGIKIEELREFSELIKANLFIQVDGVYTHFSSADNDEEYTKSQIAKFNEAVGIVKEYFDNLKYIHCSASSGILNYDVEVCNYVRPGIMIYGFKPYETYKINLKPICTLKSKISFIKQIQKGESISYGRAFISQNDMKIATVAIGYADGVRRALSNKGYLVVHNKKAPIVGNVCMDSLMVDISDLGDVKIGDDAFVWDNNVQTLEDVANDCDTINYEILSTISKRVPRITL